MGRRAINENIRWADCSGIVHVSIRYLVLMGWAGAVSAYIEESLAKEAQLSLADGRALARKARRGTITDEELEREQGGSGLPCSFDIGSGMFDIRSGMQVSADPD